MKYIYSAEDDIELGESAALAYERGCDGLLFGDLLFEIIGDVPNHMVNLVAKLETVA